MSPITGGGGGGGATALDDLSDVIISAATAGDVLNYDGTDWINSSNPHIGTGYSTMPANRASGDISSYGRLYIGQTVSESDDFSVAAISGIRCYIKQDLDATTVISAQQVIRAIVNITGAGAGTGTLTGLFLNITGGADLTSGTVSYQGLMVQAQPTVPAGTTASISGLNFTAALLGTGNLGVFIGAQIAMAGTGTAGGGSVSEGGGISAQVSGGTNSFNLLYGIRITNRVGFGTTGTITTAAAIDVGGGFLNSATVTEWSGLRIVAGITAAIPNKWSLNLTVTSSNMGSKIAHPIALGWNPATVATITARTMLSAGTTAVGQGQLKFQSGGPLTTPEAGVLEFQGERLRFTPTSLERQVVPGVLYTSTADAQVANTLVETTLVGAGVGDTTLNANFFIVGKTIRIRASGWVDTAAAAGTLQIRIRLGGIAGTVILDSTAVAIANNLAARYWNVDAIITCRTVGVGGTVIGQTAFQHMVAAQGNPVWWEMTNIAAIALDTTIAEQVVLSAQWGTADVANIIACTNFILEVLN